MSSAKMAPICLGLNESMENLSDDTIGYTDEAGNVSVLSVIQNITHLSMNWFVSISMKMFIYV